MLKVYCGSIKNDEKVRLSASGGLATAMAEEILSAGGCVYGAAYTSDFKGAEYIRIEDCAGLERLRGSKYIKARITKGILDHLEKDIRQERNILFIGLPCDINIVKAYAKGYNYKNLLCVDLICHGATSQQVAEQYISSLEKRHRSKIVKFSVRYKNPYWTPPYLLAEFQNGKKYIQPFYATDYGVAFAMMEGESCYKCAYKDKNYQSDITIGDYWGSKEGDVGYNKYGTSVAFVHTERGEEFIASLTNFNLYAADIQKAIDANPRYITPAEKTAKKEAFRENFNKKGLKYAARKQRTIKQRIARMIPQAVIKILKRK